MKAHILNIHTHRIFFLAMIGVALLSIVFYIYAVNKTVRNVASRQAIEHELSLKVAHVSELEFEYIALKNNINDELAKSLGFHPVEKTIFVSRKTSVAFLNTSSRDR